MQSSRVLLHGLAKPALERSCLVAWIVLATLTFFVLRSVSGVTSCQDCCWIAQLCPNRKIKKKKTEHIKKTVDKTTGKNLIF